MEEAGLQPPAGRTVASEKEERDARSLPPAAPLGLGPRRGGGPTTIALCDLPRRAHQVPRLSAFHSIFHIWSCNTAGADLLTPRRGAAESEEGGRPTWTQRRLRSRLAARLQAALIGPRHGPHRTEEHRNFLVAVSVFSLFFFLKRSLL